jgi:hypothetical protein
MSDESERQIVCATYTHARRHPMVLGKIGDWTPPFQLTLAQVGVLLAIPWLEVQTWRFWGAYLPRSAGFVVAIAVPCAATWAVRRARVEGRSLARSVFGWFHFAWTPRGGQVGGKAYRPARTPLLTASSVWVAPGDDRR